MKQILKKIFEKFIWWSGVIAVGIVLGLGIHLVLAWTEPTVAPSGGNILAPVNVSSAAQYKSGPLGIGGLLAAWNGFWLNNNGQDVSGKVLTADATGFGSWQAQAAGGGGGGGVPSGFVGFFNLSSCPSGWTELTAARGRYPVGLPSGGTLGATVGTALSNTENRPVGQHTHGSHEHGGGCAAGSWCSFRAASGGETGGVTDPSGTIPGTNAPYIQLLACQKN